MEETIRQHNEFTSNRSTRKLDYKRYTDAPFLEELDNARAEAAELESLTSRVPFGRPETVYLAGSALLPDIDFQTIPSSFDPIKMGTNIEQAMTQFAFVGYSYAIALNGRLAASKGIGFANDKVRQGASVFRMYPTSRVHLASVTKPLTAVGILRLIETSKEITLSSKFYDFIESRFPNADNRYRQITIEQLLSHSGGVDVAREFYCSEIEELLATTPSAAGTYQYANMNYCLLSQVIEAVSGEDYLTFMQRNVFDPAGLINVSATWADSVDYSWRWQSGGGIPAPDIDYSAVVGAYGIFLSAIEYVRFMSFLRFGRIIDRDTTLVDMLNEGTPEYRLGVSSMRSNMNGRSYWGHSGRWSDSGYGTRTGMFLTNDGIDAVILCNTRIDEEPSLVAVMRDAYEAAFD
jgi:CubicO group peptidase (beta-lactamase class C family)